MQTFFGKDPLKHVIKRCDKDESEAGYFVTKKNGGDPLNAEKWQKRALIVMKYTENSFDSQLLWIAMCFKVGARPQAASSFKFETRCNPK